MGEGIVATHRVVAGYRAVMGTSQHSTEFGREPLGDVGGRARLLGLQARPGLIGDVPGSTGHQLAGQRFVVMVVTGSLNWRSA
jgi:hypothetical protein